MKYIKTIYQSVMAVAVSSLLAACGSTSDANSQKSSLNWPNVKNATQPEGSFPNLENLSKITAGLTKTNLYHLIGKPHFSEGFGSREWNYIMKFRQADGSVKACQYKVLFGEKKTVKNVYFSPADCLSKPQQRLSLSSDALFGFGKAGVSDIKASGKAQLSRFAQLILKDGKDSNISITGYTDDIGSEESNLALSQQRAQSVAQYLVYLGISGSKISVQGLGEANPIKECDASMSRKERIDCLAPNRRVEIETN